MRSRPEIQTESADLAGGWSIEYVYGTATFDGRRVEGLHILRLFGDITRPEALRKSIDAFRRSHLMTDGPTILHSPLGPMGEFPAPDAIKSEGGGTP